MQETALASLLGCRLMRESWLTLILTLLFQESRGAKRGVWTSMVVNAIGDLWFHIGLDVI